MWRRTLLLLAGTQLLCAQPTTLDGVVVNALTGDPLAHMRVQMSGPRFDKLYAVTAAESGYRSAVRQPRLPGGTCGRLPGGPYCGGRECVDRCAGGEVSASYGHG